MPSQKPPILFHSEFIKLGQVTVTIHDDDRLLRKSNKIMVDMLVDDGRERREVSYQCENEGCERFFKGTKGKTLIVSADGSRETASFTLISENPTRERRQFQNSTSNPAPSGMRATEVRYGRKIGLPDYGSECIELVVAVENGTHVADALKFARHFVESNLSKVEPRGDRR